MRRRRNPWVQLSMESWRLGAEAATVVGLRSLKLAAGGDAAEAETRLMVQEKVQAGLTLQMMALTGGLGATPHHAAAKTIAHLRRKVRANRRRLSGS